MIGDDFVNVEATRALQESLAIRQANLAAMQRWGAYCILKVTPRGASQTSVMNYVTVLQALAGKTPRQMEDVLGLRVNQLSSGADIYRLDRLPTTDEFLPRGYTTLVDGLQLKAGLRQDRAGYRPGHGAFQVTLIKLIPASKVKSLRPDEPFDPGIHPNLKHLYPAARWQG